MARSRRPSRAASGLRREPTDDGAGLTSAVGAVAQAELGAGTGVSVTAASSPDGDHKSGAIMRDRRDDNGDRLIGGDSWQTTTTQTCSL